MQIPGIDLTEFLARAGFSPHEAVVHAHELTGGASKDIWRVDVEAGHRREAFVLRRQSHQLAQGALALPQEYAVMRAAFEAGVRVPEPLSLARDADGRDYFLMRFVEGETIAPRLFRKDAFAAARATIPKQLGPCLAPVHRVPIDARLTEALGPPREGHPAAICLEQFELAYRVLTRNPHPALELALRWLATHLPAEHDLALVHGDFRLGNFIFGNDGIRAILDWELAHFGDPAEDLAWLAVRAWRYGRDDRPVAGLTTREALRESYAAAGGVAVSAERFRWWEVFGNLRWGVITLMQAVHFLDGNTRDLEKAAIGRRTAEVEAELLNLIED